MSMAEEQVQSPPPPQASESQDASMQDTPTEPAAMANQNRKRPRIDFTIEPRERKRGKTAFGLLVGTLTKAKNEDKERNASEAAKKRQLIEQKLQEKLRKETDSVRRAEEAKKDKTSANRKEEDLQLKDSIHKLRRTRLPLLAHFLLTSDQIPSDDADSPPPSANPLAPAPRTHPPPLYYLPAILTPAQEAFLQRRKAEVKEAAEKEWAAFREERAAGIEEIATLRRRVAEEESRKKAQQAEEPRPEPEPAQGDTEMAPATNGHDDGAQEDKPDGMDVDEPSAPTEPAKEEAQEPVAEPEPEPEKEKEPKEEPAPMQADDDDAVEY